MTDDDLYPVSETEHEDDAEADLIRGNTIAEMVENAVLLGLDLEMNAYIGSEMVKITVTTYQADQDATVIH